MRAITIDKEVGTDNVVIKNNYFTNIKSTGKAEGIWVEEGVGVIIDNNIFDGVSGVGAKAIMAMDSVTSGSVSNLTITNNVIKNIDGGGEGSYGIFINGASDDLLISGNEISEIDGLFIFGIGLGGDTPGAEVTNNNVIISNPGGNEYGIGVAGSNQNDIVVEFNNIITNSDSNQEDVGMYHGADSDLDAGKNWWGDVTGPSGEGSGSGSAVGPGIVFEPWLCGPLASNPAGSVNGSCTKTTLENVSPTAGTVLLSNVGTFKLTVDADDEVNTLSELEIDHSMEGSLSEFSVYADEGNPYGTTADKQEFESKGVNVTYAAASQKWVIDFGKDMSDAFVANEGITFYLVIKDEAGNELGSMSPTSADNTFAYTVTADETPEVVVIDLSPVTVNAGSVAGASIDYSSRLTDGNTETTGILPKTTITSSVANVTIPDSTTVTGPAGWNGVIDLPSAGSSGGTAPSGFSVGGTVIEVGSPSVTLNFDRAVKITLLGVTGDV